MPATGSLERLRAANRRAILMALSGQGPMSRADLVRFTGLSRTTVSSLVAELIGTGHVSEGEERGRPHKGGSGRPPVLVSVRPPEGCVAGVDLGHEHVRVAVADGTGLILGEDTALVDVDTHARDALDTAGRLLLSTLETCGWERASLNVVGLCVPAPLDRRSSRVSTRVLPGWEGLQPAAELQGQMDVPVVADNDANMGALGELNRGAAQGATDIVYLKVASGLGAGIVLGGRLHRGASGNAGEIGHVQVGEDGAVCRCGNRGCLETLASVPRLLELLQPAFDEILTVERLRELDVAGEPAVRRVLTDAGLIMGRALADLATNVNPELLVIGGALGGSTTLLDGVRLAIDRYAQRDAAAAVRVVSGALGDRAEIEGAVALAANRATAMSVA